MGKKSQEDYKAKERWFLNKFLEYINVSPSSIVEREKPDFKIHLGSQEIGVEVTEFAFLDGSKHDSEKQQEVYRKEIQTIEASAKDIFVDGMTWDWVVFLQNGKVFSPAWG